VGTVADSCGGTCHPGRRRELPRYTVLKEEETEEKEDGIG